MRFDLPNVARPREGTEKEDSSVASPSLCSGLRLTPQNDKKRRAHNKKGFTMRGRASIMGKDEVCYNADGCPLWAKLRRRVKVNEDK